MYRLISIFLFRYQPTMKAVRRNVKQLQVEGDSVMIARGLMLHIGHMILT